MHHFIVLIYGIVVIIGGLIGFFKAGSIISLISSTALGTILIASAYAIFKKKPLGLYIAYLTSFVILTVFIIRYAMTQKPVPALPMALISVVVIILLSLRKNAKQR